MDLSNYLKVRDMMKTGDMIEWRGNILVGRAIRLFSGQKVNHTSIVLNLDDHMSDHSKFIIEANAGRFELNPLSWALKDFKGVAYWSALKPEYDCKRIGIGAWALKRVGTKYDFGSLFKNILGRVNADERKLFCSEGYFLSLRANDVVKGKIAPRPGEFGQYNVHLPAVCITA